MGYLNYSGLTRVLGKLFGRLEEKVDIRQGEDNEGCCLLVGASGELEVSELPVRVGIPSEIDRIGRARINTTNVASGPYTFTKADDSAEFEPDCVYAGSIHAYGSDSEYISNVDLTMYVEVTEGTDSLVFNNTMFIGTSVYHVTWSLDLEDETVDVVIESGSTALRLDSIFGSGGLRRMDFHIRKVQSELY
ncbi:MAG: hypothetical protein IJ242_15125 [Clostridia bacterium]|nr:hypothetical protein [Clostridia bacterium]